MKYEVYLRKKHKLDSVYDTYEEARERCIEIVGLDGDYYAELGHGDLLGKETFFGCQDLDKPFISYIQLNKQ